MIASPRSTYYRRHGDPSRASGVRLSARHGRAASRGAVREQEARAAAYAPGGRPAAPTPRLVARGRRRANHRGMVSQPTGGDDPDRTGPAVGGRPDLLEGGPGIGVPRRAARRVDRERLASAGLVGSMSRAGNPYDNAYIESFMKTLKHEEVYSTPRSAICPQRSTNSSTISPAPRRSNHRPPAVQTVGVTPLQGVSHFRLPLTHAPVSGGTLAQSWSRAAGETHAGPRSPYRRWPPRAGGRRVLHVRPPTPRPSH